MNVVPVVLVRGYVMLVMGVLIQNVWALVPGAEVRLIEQPAVKKLHLDMTAIGETGAPLLVIQLAWLVTAALTCAGVESGPVQLNFALSNSDKPAVSGSPIQIQLVPTVIPGGNILKEVLPTVPPAKSMQVGSRPAAVVFAQSPKRGLEYVFMWIMLMMVGEAMDPW